ncbi:helix-turn-helix transcriptional regulator [Enterobacter sp. UNJFSC 003]|uniref:helix-turn-helix domain-containing protein n=1 Tax=Enterobacter sp. UNJFSC 003 TaxID=3122077 RepID=UPI002E9A4C88|nr:helix-turn-helix transcriptional regulator [Serratia liquefaciens]
MACNHKNWEYDIAPYSFTGNDDIPLLVVDATQSKTVNDLPPDVLPLLQCKSILILVNALQKTFIQSLVNDFRCSLLCVDEINIHMRDIIEMAMRKKRYLSPLTLRAQHKQSIDTDIKFTPTEHRIITYFGEGLSGVEISKRLFRSEKTISSHKRRIMQKIGAKNDVELCQKINTVMSKQRYLRACL